MLPEEANAYITLIDRAGKNCYYLWGPIKNALMLEFMEGRHDLVRSVITGPLNDQQKMPRSRQEMLLFVLTAVAESSSENHKAVSSFAYQMLNDSSSLTDEANQREVKKLLSLLAGKLAICDILVSLMQDKDEAVRQEAVRDTYYLYRHQPELVLEVLESLGDSDKISRLPYKSRTRLQSCIELSTIILFEDHDNAISMAHLKQVWSGILKKLLWHSDNQRGKQGIGERITRFIRTSVVTTGASTASGANFALNLVNRTGGTDEVQGLNTVDELNFFFSSSPNEEAAKARKDRFARLIPYLRPGQNLEDVIGDLEAIAGDRDMLSTYLLMIVLVGQIEDRERVASTTKHLIEIALMQDPPTPAASMLLMVLNTVLELHPTEELPETLLNEAEAYIIAYQRDSDSVCYGNHGYSAYSGMSSFTQEPYRKYGRLNAQLLQTFVDKINSSNDDKLKLTRVLRYLHNSPPRHLQYGSNRPVLLSLAPVLKIALDVAEEETITTLANIRSYSRDEVDNFMIREGMLEELQERVRYRTSGENIAVLIAMRGTFFVREAVVRKPEGALFDLLYWWLEQAPACKSLFDWMSILLMRASNEIVGEPVFDI